MIGSVGNVKHSGREKETRELCALGKVTLLKDNLIVACNFTFNNEELNKRP